MSSNRPLYRQFWGVVVTLLLLSLRLSVAGIVPVLHVNMVAALPSELGETSSLIEYQGLLWTVVDSRSLTLYGLDPASGRIQRRIVLSQASNYDWEALTQDKEALFVADIGNNAGSRKNLRIYRLDKSRLDPASTRRTLIAKPELISLSYDSQTNFDKRYYQHPYDAEALTAKAGQLTLYNKRWQGGLTQVYSFSAKPGSYELRPSQTIRTTMLVTDAVNRGDETWLLGYQLRRGDLQPYIEEYTEQDNQLILKRRWRTDVMGQMEGIAFGSDHRLYLTREKDKYHSAALLVADLPK